MNVIKMLEIIKAAKESAPNYETRELAENFEEFLILYQGRATLLREPGYLAKLKDSHTKLMNGFECIANTNGISLDQLKDYFNNQINFSSQDWNNIQIMKDELAMKEQIEQPAFSTAPIKKLRQNKNKIRI